MARETLPGDPVVPAGRLRYAIPGAFLLYLVAAVLLTPGFRSWISREYLWAMTQVG